jgi:hypothetical protein
MLTLTLFIFTGVQRTSNTRRTWNKEAMLKAIEAVKKKKNGNS